MISIGKLTSADAAVEYLQHAVADSAIDYYAGRGESPGRWDGYGAAQLGLEGDVTAEQLRRVLSGQHPTTDQPLGRSWSSQRMVAFDVTFSAPKSVSLLYATGDDETRRAVIEAHEGGVDAVVAYLQEHAGWARQFNPVSQRVEPVRADMVMPRFRHRTARPVTDPATGETTIDPQLHTHIPIPTWVCRPDGTWSALLSEPLYMHAAAAGAVGQAAMRQILIDRLGVEVEVAPNGTFEIVGITEAQRREFSKRRQQIETMSETLGIESLHGMEVATLDTRERKPELGVGPNVFHEWKRRAERVNLDQERLSAVLHRRGPARELVVDDELVRALVGEYGLTSEAATFSRRDVTRKVAALAQDGLTPRHIESLVTQILSDAANVVALVPGEVQLSVTTDPDRDESARVVLTEERFSTPDMVALEARMLETARVRRGRSSAVEDVARVIASRPSLTDGQRRLIETVCTSTDGVIIVEGVAGSGKTFALDACREAFEAAGHKVVGLALAGRAAETLEQEAAIRSHTIASALHHLREERFEPGTLIVVDEAGMVGSRQIAELVAIAARDGAKLVLCGDPHQLQPIDAGAGFRALGEQLGKTVLDQNIRQHEIWEREGLRLVREGRGAEAVAIYQEHDRVDIAPTAQVRRERIVEAFVEQRSAGRDAIIVTQSRDEAAAINELARAVREASGALTGPELAITGRPFRVGDEVVCLRTKRGQGITNGLRGEVVAIDAERGRLTVGRAGERHVVIDVARYPHIDYGYALTAHKAQGITADVALVVGSDGATKEWTYSALSRARRETRYFTVAQSPEADRDGVHHEKESELTIAQRLANSWSRSESKDSTMDYGPARKLTPEEQVSTSIGHDQKISRL